MNYGQARLIRDAAQRSANYLYLEEEIARYEKSIILSEPSSASTVASFDPCKIHVMTALEPEHVLRLEDAINSCLDEDAEGVFTYVSSEDEGPKNQDDNENNSTDDDTNDVAIIRQSPPPDAGLISVHATLNDIRMKL